MPHQPNGHQIRTVIDKLDDLRFDVTIKTADVTILRAVDLLREIGRDDLATNLNNGYRTRKYARVGGISKQAKFLIQSATLGLHLSLDDAEVAS